MSEITDVTRERILSAAEALILSRGFAGTTIEDVTRAAQLSRATFFRHFRTRTQLGRAVAVRYFDADIARFKAWWDEAERRSSDPLKRALIFLELYENYLRDDGGSRCAFLAACLPNDDGLGALFEIELRLRLARLQRCHEESFVAIIHQRQPVIDVSAEALAEMTITLIEGGLILGVARRDPSWLVRQIAHMRRYLKLLFAQPTLSTTTA